MKSLGTFHQSMPFTTCTVKNMAKVTRPQVLPHGSMWDTNLVNSVFTTARRNPRFLIKSQGWSKVGRCRREIEFFPLLLALPIFSLPSFRIALFGLRPYHPDHTRSHLISAAKQGWVWVVLGWENCSLWPTGLLVAPPLGCVPFGGTKTVLSPVVFLDWWYAGCVL